MYFFKTNLATYSHIAGFVPSLSCHIFCQTKVWTVFCTISFLDVLWMNARPSSSLRRERERAVTLHFLCILFMPTRLHCQSTCGNPSCTLAPLLPCRSWRCYFRLLIGQRALAGSRLHQPPANVVGFWWNHFKTQSVLLDVSRKKIQSLFLYFLD